MEKNDNVRFLRSLFKTLEWITILGLFVVGGCFVRKVWIAYQSKETSVKHYTVKSRFSEVLGQQDLLH